MFVELSLLSNWVGRARTANGLLERACAKDMTDFMDQFGDRHVETAGRLLAEAAELGSTEASSEKRRMALTQLEVAYDAFAKQPAGWRGTMSKVFYRARYVAAHKSAATVSMLSAGTYAAIGVDVKSVDRCLQRCVVHLWERHIFMWMDACSGGAPPADIRTPQLIADEHGVYIGGAMIIADLVGLGSTPRVRDDWPHWRDRRVREQSRLI